MRRLFANLLRKYFGISIVRTPDCPEWTSDDAANFATFLKTATGRALRARMHSLTSVVCVSGCQNAITATHSAGIGAGWKECTDKFFEHAKISRTAGAQAEDETAPEGEEQLLERMSP